MVKHNFKKLTIWQDALKLCNMVYDYTEGLPIREKYNLCLQLEKCAVSIPSNIAEGSGKRTNKHFAEFITTSLSSAYEMETQLLICEMRKYGNQENLKILLEKLNVLQTQLANFRETIIKE